LRPTMMVVIILATIAGFQAFDFIYTLTGGGPVRATTLMVQYIYENGFSYPCGDVDVLADRLASIAALGEDGRRRFGDRSQEIVAGFGLDVATRATENAVRAVCARGVAT